MSRRSGQGTRPGVAMAVCVVFTALVGAGLWYSTQADAPPPPPPPVAAPQGPTPEQVALQQDDQQAALVLDEDDRIEATVFTRPPRRPPHGPATTVLPPAPGPYGLESLIRLGAAHRESPTVVDVVNHVVVLPGAKLDIVAPGTTLRLASGPGGFVSIVGWQGAIALSGTADQPLTVVSWDAATAAPDAVAVDGRAYVRTIGSDLSTSAVHLAGLGFWSGRTGGVALTGIAGGPATGTLAATEVRDSYYGLYTSDTAKVAVTDSTFASNMLDGVLLHRGSTNVAVERTVAVANGGDGFVADRGSSGVVLKQVTARGNGGDGVRFDGRPLTDGPGPAGASPVGHQDFRIEGSLVRANRGDGVRAVDTGNIVITGNEVNGHADGIEVTDRTAGAQVTDNKVTGATGAGITVHDGPSGVVVERNRVSGGTLGLQVRDAQADLRDNVVTAATEHGLSIVGAVNGSSATGNSLAGRGRSALDSARLAPGATIVLDRNNEDKWVVDIPFGEYLANLVRDHPLLPMWAVVLLVPVLLLLVRRRLNRNARPYVETPAEPGTAPGEQGGETVLVPVAVLRAAAAAAAPVRSDPLRPRLQPAHPRPHRSSGAGSR